MKQQIAAVRAEMHNDQIKKLIPKYHTLVADQYGDVEGTLMRWTVKFPDNDTVYYYAVIRGSNDRWYKTYSNAVFTTEQLVDEMVRLSIESESFEVD